MVLLVWILGWFFSGGIDFLFVSLFCKDIINFVLVLGSLYFWISLLRLVLSCIILLVWVYKCVFVLVFFSLSKCLLRWWMIFCCLLIFCLSLIIIECILSSCLLDFCSLWFRLWICWCKVLFWWCWLCLRCYNVSMMYKIIKIDFFVIIGGVN